MRATPNILAVSAAALALGASFASMPPATLPHRTETPRPKDASPRDYRDRARKKPTKAYLKLQRKRRMRRSGGHAAHNRLVTAYLANPLHAFTNNELTRFQRAVGGKLSDNHDIALDWLAEDRARRAA